MNSKERYKKLITRPSIAPQEVLAVDSAQFPLTVQTQALVELGYQAITDVEISPVTRERFQWWERIQPNHSTAI